MKEKKKTERDRKVQEPRKHIEKKRPREHEANMAGLYRNQKTGEK